MAKAENERTYVFLTETYDTQGDFTRQYFLSFFLADGFISMYDPKNKRQFLKKSYYPQICLDDLFVDSTVTILGKQYKIIDFADSYTKSRLGSAKEKTVALLKDLNAISPTLTGLANLGFKVSETKLVILTKDVASDFSERAAGYAGVPVYALEVVGQGSEEALLKLGGESIVTADGSKHALIFDNSQVRMSVSTGENMGDASVVVLKPHVVLTGQSGAIIARLAAEGLTTGGAWQISLDRQAANEWLDVYRDVYPEWNSAIDHFTAGPCLVLKVTGEGAFDKVRDLCGPINPVIGSKTDPTSLRAQYGIDTVKNGVQCTDLVEDVNLESTYFFETLHSSHLIKSQKW